MAIIRNDKTSRKTGNIPNMGMNQQQNQTQQQTPPDLGGYTQEVKTDRPNVRRAIPRTMKRSRQDSILSTLSKSVEEVCADHMQARGFDVVMVPVDAVNYEMHYSCAAIAARGEVNGKLVTLIYTLVLEGSNSKPPRLSVNSYNMHVEIVRTAMDAFDEDTWKSVVSAVENSQGPSEEYLNAGACALPASVDPEDESRVWEVIYGAMEAIWTRYETSWPELSSHFSIVEYMDPKEQKTTAHFHFLDKDGQTEDVSGNAIRSDFRLELAFSDRQDDRTRRSNASSFQHSGSRVVSEISGFVNLSYNPQQMHMGMGYNQPPQYLFTPQLVYTGFTGRDYPMTPEFMLLSMTITFLLGDNYAWGNCYRNFDREEIHDIGAIGYRIPDVAKAIDTKEQSFGQDEMFSILRQYVSPVPAYTVRCEDLGPNSWMTDMFKAAADGNNDAILFITAAMDRLTNNRFGAIWAKSTEPMALPYTRVHLGTYLTTDGQQRDLADIDSLALLNLSGGSDINSVNQWEMTFADPMGMPTEVLLERRLKMIEEITRYTADIRGHATDVLLTGSFVRAMFEAVRGCNLSVDQDGLYTSYGNSYMPANNILSQHTAIGMNANSMMNMGFGGGGGVQRNVFSRW